MRGQWAENLAIGAKAYFTDDYQELPATYPQIFDVETSGRAFEDDLVATGMPIVVSRPEGEPIAFDRPQFRGRVRYIHAGFGLGYEITEEAFDDDLYNTLNSKAATNLARSHRETEEIVAANVFNLGFTTVQAYDGVSLFNTAHPGVGITQSNRSDVDLSVAALKAAMERYFNMRTDRNIRINMAPDRILVNHNNWWTLQEILGTQFLTAAGTPVNSDRMPNVVTNFGLQPIMWRYLTDNDAWFLLASRAQLALRFYWRKRPMPVDGFEKRTRIFWFGIISRFTAGVTRWQGLDGSAGA
jgi:hypothetical protein